MRTYLLGRRQWWPDLAKSHLCFSMNQRELSGYLLWAQGHEFRKDEMSISPLGIGSRYYLQQRGAYFEPTVVLTNHSLAKHPKNWVPRLALELSSWTPFFLCTDTQRISRSCRPVFFFTIILCIHNDCSKNYKFYERKME